MRNYGCLHRIRELDMKLTQLSENELKIILSKEDLSELDLTLHTIDYNTTKTRKAIWDIFDRARAQTGFDAAKNKIYVKLYPLSDGGCEMYVSKIFGKSDVAFYRTRVARRQMRYVGVNQAFYFEDFDGLYNACKSLRHNADSALYVAPNGGYILLIKKARHSAEETARWSEFSTRIKNRHVAAYLDERCRVLCESNATEKIIGQQKGS